MKETFSFSFKYLILLKLTLSADPRPSQKHTIQGKRRILALQTQHKPSQHPAPAYAQPSASPPHHLQLGSALPTSPPLRLCLCLPCFSSALPQLASALPASCLPHLCICLCLAWATKGVCLRRTSGVCLSRTD